MMLSPKAFDQALEDVLRDHFDFPIRTGSSRASAGRTVIETMAIRGITGFKMEVVTRLGFDLPSDVGEPTTARRKKVLDSPLVSRFGPGETQNRSGRVKKLVLCGVLSDGVAPLARGLLRLKDALAQEASDILGVIAVPHMTDAGERLCREARTSWIDLAGNADIRAPDLMIHVRGRPPRFLRRGRKGGPFAAKASRIVRHLLMHPEASPTQRELARATGLDDGYVSRIVKKLKDDDLILRKPDGAVVPKNPGLLLDAWRKAYDFKAHMLLPGFVAASSTEALLRTLDSRLKKKEMSYAATGLAGARQWSSPTEVYVATVLVAKLPSKDWLRSVGFQEGKDEANLTWVLANDPSEFWGAEDRGGIAVAHPLQVYLDLKSHPERTTKAARHIRRRYLDTTKRPEA